MSKVYNPPVAVSSNPPPTIPRMYKGSLTIVLHILGNCQQTPSIKETIQQVHEARKEVVKQEQLFALDDLKFLDTGADPVKIAQRLRRYARILAQ